MASLNGHSLESEADSRSYKRSGNGDQPICEQNGTPRDAGLNTTSQAVTRQRSPTKWKLVGLARDTPLHNDTLQNHSDHLNSASPPDLPPRRMSDDPENRREKPPTLTSRIASDSQAKGQSAGFVRGRKGGFSGMPSKWEKE